MQKVDVLRHAGLVEVGSTQRRPSEESRIGTQLPDCPQHMRNEVVTADLSRADAEPTGPLLQLGRVDHAAVTSRP